MNNRIFSFLVLVITILLGWYAFGSLSDKGFGYSFGLDLQGGSRVVFKADTSSIDDVDVDDSMKALRDVIERRVNALAVSEALVQTEESSFLSEAKENRLIVELPGITDVNKAVEMIGKTPSLEFKLLKEEVVTDNATTTLANSLSTTTVPEKRISLIDTGLNGTLLKRSQVAFDQMTNTPYILVEFNNEGKDLLKKITSENIGVEMAIILDGEILSAPVIQSEIPDGQAQITGNFQRQEAIELVRNLNLGALPVPVSLIETQSIGPVLGQETLVKIINAFGWGFLIVSLFMIFWYRLNGFISVIALAIYSMIMLALFKFIPVTLTSSGLAGFILSIGMAVDANVLIFERLKEEKRAGKKGNEAINASIKRAWSSIRDGNISSLIAAFFLYWVSGSPVVQGFAIVFGIGIIVSMVTAVFVSGLFMKAFTRSEITK